MPNPIRRRRMRGGGAFVPPEIGSLQLRLLAETGTFQDSALTTPTVNSTDPVGGWLDQSGHANNALQATAGNRTTWETNAFGALPGIRFTSASSQYLSADGAAAAFSGTDLPFTHLVVFRLLANGIAECPMSLGNSGNVGPYCLMHIAATNIPQINRRNDAQTGNLTVNGTAQVNINPHLLVLWFDGTNGRVLWDGQQLGTTTAINVGLTTLNRYTLGCWRRNEAGVGINLLNGYMGELAAYNAALTDSSIAQWTRYSTRYGVVPA